MDINHVASSSWCRDEVTIEVQLRCVCVLKLG